MHHFSIHHTRDAHGGGDIRSADRVPLELSAGLHRRRLLSGWPLRASCRLEGGKYIPENCSQHEEEQQWNEKLDDEIPDHAEKAEKAEAEASASRSAAFILLLFLGRALFGVRGGVGVGCAHARSHGRQHRLG
jgi:hypothetical protein